MERKIVSDGVDITESIAPYFISLTVRDEAGHKSDSAELRLADNGTFQFPSKQSELQIWTGDDHGLVYKGSYTVDDVELTFPGDEITILASASRQRQDMKAPRDRSWHDISIGEIVNVVAAQNGLTPAINSTLSNIVLGHREQLAQSDGDFLTALADQHGATFKVANGKLVFFQRGDGANVSGQAIPAIDIPLTGQTQGNMKLLGKLFFKSAAAHYHDFGAGERIKVETGSESPQKILPGDFDTEQDARFAAHSELQKLQEREYELEIKKMPANPRIRAEQLIRLTGHRRDQINGLWMVQSVSETQDKSGFWSQISAVKPKDSDIPSLEP